VEIVAEIAHWPETEDLSLTTNGFFLDQLASPLYQAGLRRINISLDSLNPDTFNQIIGNTNGDRWQKTWLGIQKAYQVGFDPLKLNVVIIPRINDHEVEALAALSIDRNWHIRFIEFMPIGNSSLFQKQAWIPSEELRQRIRQKWGLETAQVRGNGPADVFQIPGAKGTLGFISQMTECFCDRCNRMRLSADGWLRPCLLNETGQLDLKTALRSGKDVGYLQEKVRELLTLKPEINFKERESGTGTSLYSRTMSQIGG
jgi:cyclic pyranopterin phosphate synthase